MVSHNAYLNANIASVRPGEQTTWERWHGMQAVQEDFWHGFDAWGPTQGRAWEPTQAVAWEPADTAWHSAAAWGPTQPDAVAWEATQREDAGDAMHDAWDPMHDPWAATQELPAVGTPTHHHRGNRQGHMCL